MSLYLLLSVALAGDIQIDLEKRQACIVNGQNIYSTKLCIAREKCHQKYKSFTGWTKTEKEYACELGARTAMNFDYAEKQMNGIEEVCESKDLELDLACNQGISFYKKQKNK